MIGPADARLTAALDQTPTSHVSNQRRLPRPESDVYTHTNSREIPQGRALTNCHACYSRRLGPGLLEGFRVSTRNPGEQDANVAQSACSLGGDDRGLRAGDGRASPMGAAGSAARPGGRTDG